VDCNTIGDRLKALRMHKGDTQAEVAIALNVKRQTVDQWENNSRDIKTQYTIDLANYYGVTCDYILRGVKTENVDIHNATGLSDKAISRLKFNKKLIANPRNTPEAMELFKQNLQTINDLIEDDDVITCISDYIYFDMSSGDILYCEMQYKNGKREKSIIYGDTLIESKYSKIRKYLDEIRSKKKSCEL